MGFIEMTVSKNISLAPPSELRSALFKMCSYCRLLEEYNEINGEYRLLFSKIFNGEATIDDIKVHTLELQRKLMVTEDCLSLQFQTKRPVIRSCGRLKCRLPECEHSSVTLTHVNKRLNAEVESITLPDSILASTSTSAGENSPSASVATVKLVKSSPGPSNQNIRLIRPSVSMSPASSNQKSFIINPNLVKPSPNAVNISGKSPIYSLPGTRPTIVNRSLVTSPTSTNSTKTTLIEPRYLNQFLANSGVKSRQVRVLPSSGVSFVPAIVLPRKASSVEVDDEEEGGKSVKKQKRDAPSGVALRDDDDLIVLSEDDDEEFAVMECDTQIIPVANIPDPAPRVEETESASKVDETEPDPKVDETVPAPKAAEIEPASKTDEIEPALQAQANDKVSIEKHDSSTESETETGKLIDNEPEEENLKESDDVVSQEASEATVSEEKKKEKLEGDDDIKVAPDLIKSESEKSN